MRTEVQCDYDIEYFLEEASLDADFREYIYKILSFVSIDVLKGAVLESHNAIPSANKKKGPVRIVSYFDLFFLSIRIVEISNVYEDFSVKVLNTGAGYSPYTRNTEDIESIAKMIEGSITKIIVERIIE